jgi:hypothetical protein
MMMDKGTVIIYAMFHPQKQICLSQNIGLKCGLNAGRISGAQFRKGTFIW